MTSREGTRGPARWAIVALLSVGLLTLSACGSSGPRPSAPTPATVGPPQRATAEPFNSDGAGGISVAPRDSQVAYATIDRGTFATKDGALTWFRSFEQPLEIQFDASDAAVAYGQLAPKDGKLCDVAIPPCLVRTEDGGVTWQSVVPPTPGNLIVDLAEPNVLYASSGGKSSDRGASWSSTDFHSIVGVAGATVLSWDQDHGYSVSVDGGVTFRPLSDASTDTDFYLLDTDVLLKTHAGQIGGGNTGIFVKTQSPHGAPDRARNFGAVPGRLFPVWSEGRLFSTFEDGTIGQSTGNGDPSALDLDESTASGKWTFVPVITDTAHQLFGSIGVSLRSGDRVYVSVTGRPITTVAVAK